MTTAFVPNTFLIGAQKAGTTTLAGLLAQHPQICVSEPKEVHYFSRDYAQGPAWYARRFRNQNLPITIDASTTYSMHPIRAVDADHWRSQVPERIHSARNDARFIYILRNPVNRAWSAWNHEVQTGREARSFSEAVRAPTSMLIDIGDYNAQLEFWLRLFPLDRFYFLEFDNFLSDQLGELKQLLSWLGVEADVTGMTPEHLNSNLEMGRVGKFLTRKTLETPQLAGIRTLLPSSIKLKLRTFLSSGKNIKKNIDDDTAAFIIRNLEDSWTELMNRTDIRIDHWR